MKSRNVIDELKRRGFVQQETDPEKLYELLGNESVTFYVGIDPTADSLHAGHLLPVMGMAIMQRYGHRPIAIVGGGTAMVGDPSGKTEMRKMLTREQIVENSRKIKLQLARYLDFSADKALLVDNYEWLGKLNYIDFLRDIGRHFSVNKMLTYETYKRRMETGLSFLEFNYQLLQAYDFYMLYKNYNCRLQMGGDDQWANILAGADLIRRIEGADAYGHTFPLLTTATGAKMGKTEAGALWLDPEKTSPYDYYQYWVNVDDRDVKRFLLLYTLLPAEEIEELGDLHDREYNIAKTILAWEATQLTHGRQAAQEAMSAAMAAFGKREIPESFIPSSTVPRAALQIDDTNVPGGEISSSELAGGIQLVELMQRFDLVKSRSEARRLIHQGGVNINNERIQDSEQMIDGRSTNQGRIEIRLGKKKYFYINVH
ncbi:MAG TPA: tyrosine--tRNA ligase [bacterium]|nr:tyrosine--tRNA ligase [bacterium]HPN45884.1 tyrosine--tRNA ligase [bacterium]